MKLFLIIPIFAVCLISCKARSDLSTVVAVQKSDENSLNMAPPPPVNWCFPAAEFRAVPIGAPYLAVVCQNDNCGGKDQIIRLDASCNSQVKLNSESRPILTANKSEYVYETFGPLNSGFKGGSVLPCGDAIRVLDAHYDTAGIDGDCRFLKNTRLENQYTISIVKVGLHTSPDLPDLPERAPGSKIARDLRRFTVDGKSVTDLLDDMTDVIGSYEDEFLMNSAQISGCLMNSRIAGNMDIQAHAYCRLPHEARRCFGGLINEYRLHCPRTRLSDDPRAFVKTYSPDLRKAFETCFIENSSRAFVNQQGTAFPYFREQGKEWRAKLFLHAFDGIEGLRDFSIESQIDVIKNSKQAFNIRRVVDAYPAWQENQQRYHNIVLNQIANIQMERKLQEQMIHAGVEMFTIDMVAPPCDRGRFLPNFGGEAARD